MTDPRDMNGPRFRWLIIAIVALVTAAMPTASAAPESEASGEVEPRIIGGDPTTGQPWMGAVLRDGVSDPNSALLCGATLIRPQYVLTAAHCPDIGGTAISVALGQTLLSSITPADRIGWSELEIHPGWAGLSDPTTVDLAVIELDTPVDADGLPINVTPALPSQGQPLTVLGWGTTNTDWTEWPDQLQTGSVQALSAPGGADTECGWSVNTNDDFCYGTPQVTVNACVGDSGGPLIGLLDDGVTTGLLGVVSYGPDAGCLQPQQEVAQQVAPHAAWIEATIAAMDATPPSFPSGDVTAEGTSYDELSITWTEAWDNNRVDFYVVEIDLPTKSLPVVVNVPAPASSVVVDGLEPDTTYSVTVRAVDPSDLQSPTLETTAKTQPAPPTVGLVDTTQGRWYLRDLEGSVTSFYYGNPDDVPVMGDWDCDGVDTPGLFRTSDAFAYLRDSNTQGIADIRFFFGNPSDVPLAGDWNGDGCDTLSIYRPGEARFFIINRLGENEGGLGEADFDFYFGNVGDKPVVGDWDGDGKDEVGLHRESTGFFYFRTTLTTGAADDEFFFGDPGDRFVAGDWGLIDGTDTPAVFRPSDTTFYFRHTLTPGVADSTLPWPNAPGLVPVAGYFP